MAALNKEFCMKHGKFVVWTGALILLCAVLFMGCDTTTGGGDDGGKYLSAVEVASNEIVYFSLRTGETVEASEANTTDWDIAVTRTSDGNMPPKGVYRLVLTNSGVTATEKVSSGAGGVWYTGTTDFKAVTNADIARVIADSTEPNNTYHEDVTRYVDAAMGGPASPLARAMNVMTYVGYDNETVNQDGTTEGKYFSNNYTYDKKQFYLRNSSDAFVPTYQVYIIKHADESGYSKIQIEYEYVSGSPAKDRYLIKYKNL